MSITKTLGFSSPGAGLMTAGGMAFSAYGQSKQNHENRRAAKHQRDWQQGMSSTAHRREVNDLKLAGLNPILSATGGSGASTGSSPLPQIGNSAKSAIEGARSGLSARNEMNTGIILKERAKQERSNTFRINADNRAQELNAAIESDINSAIYLDKNAMAIKRWRKTLGDINTGAGINAVGNLGTSAISLLGKLRQAYKGAGSQQDVLKGLNLNKTFKYK